MFQGALVSYLINVYLHFLLSRGEFHTSCHTKLMLPQPSRWEGSKVANFKIEMMFSSNLFPSEQILLRKADQHCISCHVCRLFLIVMFSSTSLVFRPNYFNLGVLRLRDHLANEEPHAASRRLATPVVEHLKHIFVIELIFAMRLS